MTGNVVHSVSEGLEEGGDLTGVGDSNTHSDHVTSFEGSEKVGTLRLIGFFVLLGVFNFTRYDMT